jgi:hypothetical protein
MYELGIPMNKMQMNNVLTFPYYYCINILPDKLKEYAVTILDNHIKKISGIEEHFHIKNYYDVIKKYLYSEPHKSMEKSFESLKRFSETKDMFRNESFVKTFPYYKEWYESSEIKSFEETFPNFEPFVQPTITTPQIENNEIWKKLI